MIYLALPSADGSISSTALLTTVPRKRTWSWIIRLAIIITVNLRDAGKNKFAVVYKFLYTAWNLKNLIQSEFLFVSFKLFAQNVINANPLCNLQPGDIKFLERGSLLKYSFQFFLLINYVVIYSIYFDMIAGYDIVVVSQNVECCNALVCAKHNYELSRLRLHTLTHRIYDFYHRKRVYLSRNQASSKQYSWLQFCYLATHGRNKGRV